MMLRMFFFARRRYRIRCVSIVVFGAALAFSRLLDPSAGGAVHAADASFRAEVVPLLEVHCLKCHGAKKQSGGIRLDNLPVTVGKDIECGSAVRNQIRDGLMPPPKETRLGILMQPSWLIAHSTSFDNHPVRRGR